MKLVIDVNAKGNENMISRIEAILATDPKFVTLAQSVKLPSFEYYKVTVKADDSEVIDKFGDVVETETADDKVTFIRTKALLLTEKDELLHVCNQGLASAADLKAKRITVEASDRAAYSLDVLGYELGEKKVIYTIIDSTGQCEALASFTTQIVFSAVEASEGVEAKTADQAVIEYAVEKGLLPEVIVHSSVTSVIRKDVEEKKED